MSEKKHQNLRIFNRRFFNPVIKLIAGRFLYALVQHTGRSSRRVYTTPVVAALKDGAIYIPLPYGADTDWFLNVQARGEGAVKINGKWYQVEKPVIVEVTAALPAFSAWLQRSFIRAGIKQFTCLMVCVSEGNNPA